MSPPAARPSRPSTTIGFTRRALSFCLAVTSSACLIISVGGATWTHEPARPDVQTPDASLTFADLNFATLRSPSAIQAAYFGWAGLLAVTSSVGIVVAATTIRHRTLPLLESAAALLMLAVTVLAIKGPLDWGAFVDSLANVRIGGYLIVAGFLLALAHARTARADAHATDDRSTVESVDARSDSIPLKAL